MYGQLNPARCTHCQPPKTLHFTIALSAGSLLPSPYAASRLDQDEAARGESCEKTRAIHIPHIASRSIYVSHSPLVCNKTFAAFTSKAALIADRTTVGVGRHIYTNKEAASVAQDCDKMMCPLSVMKPKPDNSCLHPDFLRLAQDSRAPQMYKYAVRSCAAAKQQNIEALSTQDIM